MIQRRKPLARSTKPIARTSARKKAIALIKRTFFQPRARRPKAGDKPKYRRWLIDNCRCVVCSQQEKYGWLRPAEIWYQIIDPAHTQNGGMGLKGPDETCAPLCRFHHREYDAGKDGKDAFCEKYKISMVAEAAAHYALYLLIGSEA